MTRSTLNFAATVGATLFALSASAPDAFAQWFVAPSGPPIVLAPWLRAPPPPPYFIYHPGPDDDPYPAIYLNGWSTSRNPHDCNEGCVNSNGG